MRNYLRYCGKSLIDFVVRIVGQPKAGGEIAIFCMAGDSTTMQRLAGVTGEFRVNFA